MSEEKIHVRLMPRHAEAAIWVGRGLRDYEIAERMGVSLLAVKGYLRYARLATGARNSAQLAVMVALQRERDRAKRESC